MKRARILVVGLGLLVTGYLLIQYYFFDTCPIGVMCSANQTDVAMKILAVVAATGVSYWLLRTDPEQPKQEDKPQV